MAGRENNLVLRSALIAACALTMRGSGARDVHPPIFTYLSGPPDNAIVTEGDWCMPMGIKDDVSGPQELQVRSRINGRPWSRWSQELVSCVMMPPGSHTFDYQARDGAGNVSEMLSRNITVRPPTWIK